MNLVIRAKNPCRSTCSDNFRHNPGIKLHVILISEQIHSFLTILSRFQNDQFMTRWYLRDPPDISSLPCSWCPSRCRGIATIVVPVWKDVSHCHTYSRFILHLSWSVSLEYCIEMFERLASTYLAYLSPQSYRRHVSTAFALIKYVSTTIPLQHL